MSGPPRAAIPRGAPRAQITPSGALRTPFPVPSFPKRAHAPAEAVLGVSRLPPRRSRIPAATGVNLSTHIDGVA